MRPATMMLAVVVVLVAAPAWADYEAGLEAIKRGDYATALKEWRPLAEQGHAAAQGYAEAQRNLGVMYAKGEGVPQDYVQARMWVNLAAAQGNEQARKAVDLLAEKMTPAQIAEAQRLAREWKPKGK